MRIEHTVESTAALREETLALVEAARARQGRPVLGEDAERHLRAGAHDWTGLLARDDEGTLTGVATLRWSPADARPRAVAEIVVDPGLADADGLARALLAEAADRVRAGGGGELWLWVHHVADPSATYAADAGLSVGRDLAVMTRALDEAPAVELPAGVTVRAYEPGADDTALLELNNLAFAEHPEQGGWDETTLAERRKLAWFDAADVLLAVRGQRLAGFHWTKRHEGDGAAPVGEVYVLAVHPDEQGTGLGRGLLAAGLAHLHRRGCRRALLYVDLASTGAVRLYESAGFRVAHHEVCYTMRV